MSYDTCNNPIYSCFFFFVPFNRITIRATVKTTNDKDGIPFDDDNDGDDDRDGPKTAALLLESNITTTNEVFRSSAKVAIIQL